MKSQRPLEFQLTGPLEGQLMVFIHGWPDNKSLWDRQVAFFSKKYCCVCFSLPLFGNEENLADKPNSFSDLIEIIKSTILKAQERSNGNKVILVGHDWGAFLTYLLCKSYPDIIDRVITMDVGAHMSPTSFSHAAFVLSYQWWLIGAWTIGKTSPFLGAKMSQVFASRYGAPSTDTIRSDMNYPYYFFWRSLITKTESDLLFSRNKMTHPLLYLYGKNKKYMFHSEKWISKIEQNKHSKVLGIANAGHWLMVDQPQKVNESIEDWLREAPSS